MQLYDRGIRRRLAPMLGNDRRRLELAFSLLFSLPGTPMMQYGDEIGIGDDLRLPERECARTPMQWTSDRHGGFSAREAGRAAGDRRPGLRLSQGERRRPAARSAVAPELDGADDPHAQGMPGDQLGQLRRPPHQRAARCWRMRYDWRDTSLVTLHNFSDTKQKVQPQGRGAARRAARRGVRRPAQPPAPRRLASIDIEDARLALVSRRRGRQRPRPLGPGALAEGEALSVRSHHPPAARHALGAPARGPAPLDAGRRRTRRWPGGNRRDAFERTPRE